MPTFQAIERYALEEQRDTATADALADADKSLSFIRKYTNKVDSLDLSGPSSAWYAPSAIFYNGNGNIYNGGKAIWEWMHGLFSPFARIQHLIKSTRVLSGMQYGGEGRNLLILETETSFWLKKPLDGEAMLVPRLLTFLVGPTEAHDEGTDGMQIWQAKAYWDTAVLEKEVGRRRSSLRN